MELAAANHQRTADREDLLERLRYFRETGHDSPNQPPGYESVREEI
jgi:hypothetical protein